MSTCINLQLSPHGFCIFSSSFPETYYTQVLNHSFILFVRPLELSSASIFSKSFVAAEENEYNMEQDHSSTQRPNFGFTVCSRPSGVIRRNEVLNPPLICSLTIQGVDDLDVHQLSAAAFLRDMSGRAVGENYTQNYNASLREFSPTDQIEDTASGSCNTHYFRFDTMTISPDPGDYCFEIHLYNWSSGVDLERIATTTSSSFSVV